MTRRDRTTRRRAKGLWTGSLGRFSPQRRHSAAIALRGYSVRELKKLGRHISPQGRRLPLTTGLKPYWGKPAVRNFREGRGDVMHGLMPICHEARKGRTQRKALAYTSARLISTQRTAIKA